MSPFGEAMTAMSIVASTSRFPLLVMVSGRLPWAPVPATMAGGSDTVPTMPERSMVPSEILMAAVVVAASLVLSASMRPARGSTIAIRK